MMESFDSLLKARPMEISEAKRKGIKVVGSLCMYVPEEIIHASGLIPIRLAHGGEVEIQSTGERYIRQYVCPFARATVGYRAEETNPYHKSVDALAEAYTCDAMRFTLECWHHYFKVPTFLLGLPRAIGGPEYYRSQALEYFTNEINWFKKELENLSGKNISEASIKESIDLYNSIRERLREMYEYLKEDSSPIGWEDAFKIVHAGFSLDAKKYLGALEELCGSLKEKEIEEKEGPRLLITGSIMAAGDYKIINILNEIGGNVAVDNLCTGSRSFWDLVENSGDPIRALADRYLKIPACARSPYADKRLEFLSDLIKDYRVDGVIYYTIKFCESYGDEAQLVRDYLREKHGIPMYHIDTEYGVADVGPIRTRLEAFLEMLGGS